MINGFDADMFYCLKNTWDFVLSRVCFQNHYSVKTIVYVIIKKTDERESLDC